MKLNKEEAEGVDCIKFPAVYKSYKALEAVNTVVLLPVVYVPTLQYEEVAPVIPFRNPVFNGVSC